MTATNPTYLRLSVTDKCDMRCLYCMPKGSLAPADSRAILSKDEIVRIVELFAKNGATKVRMTGGDPLLRDDSLKIISAIARVPEIAEICLTTNGLLLSELAKPLLESGVTHINVSLDSLQCENFYKITGSKRLNLVLDGINTAVQLNSQKIKTNTVIMRGVNDHEIPAIAELARELPIDVRFIELMPIGHIRSLWKSLFVPAKEIMETIGDIKPTESEPNSSARLFKMQGYAGRIGIISPVSAPFCDTCNRIRITSRGDMIPCLRSNDTIDIRLLLDHPNAAEKISELLSHLSKSPAVQTTAMSSIGG